MTVMTKKSIVEDILRAYRHDYEAEGNAISKRRLWYILKPLFVAEKMSGITHKGKPVGSITNQDFNKCFNFLAATEEGFKDDYISDNSRITVVGERLPHIIIAAEKKTIDTTALALAERFGCSCYIAGGFSSIYAAKKLTSEIRETSNKPIVVLMMSDHDKAGYEIVDTVQKHFNDCYTYKTLIYPKQVPADKVDEYFGFSKKYVYHYELDVLNIKQLEAAFLENIPSHISDEIKASYREKLRAETRDTEIKKAVESDADVIAITKKYWEIVNKKEAEYSERFDDADPLSIGSFTVKDLYYDDVIVDVDEWMVA